VTREAARAALNECAKIGLGRNDEETALDVLRNEFSKPVRVPSPVRRVVRDGPCPVHAWCLNGPRCTGRHVGSNKPGIIDLVRNPQQNREPITQLAVCVVRDLQGVSRPYVCSGSASGTEQMWHINGESLEKMDPGGVKNHRSAVASLHAPSAGPLAGHLLVGLERGAYAYNLGNNEAGSITLQSPGDDGGPICAMATDGVMIFTTTDTTIRMWDANNAGGGFPQKEWPHQHSRRITAMKVLRSSTAAVT